jgi:hypothetical protein
MVIPVAMLQLAEEFENETSIQETFDAIDGCGNKCKLLPNTQFI